jgi:uncharacterized membrane protein
LLLPTPDRLRRRIRTDSLVLRWGWLVLTLSGVGIVLLVAALSVGWWYMTRNKAGYEPLEGEEDE